MKEQLYPLAIEVYEMASVGLDIKELEQALSTINKMTVNLKKT